MQRQSFRFVLASAGLVLTLFLFQNCGNGVSLNEASIQSSFSLSADSNPAGSTGTTNNPSTGNPSGSPTPSPTPAVSLLKNAWISMTTSGAPANRSGAVQVWTGSKMLVFGGQSRDSNLRGIYFNDLHAYDPVSNTWEVLSNLGAPTGRSGAKGFWTGTELIVIGGFYANPADAITRTRLDGGIYNIANNTWRAISSTNIHPAIPGSAMVWTGSKLLAYGGGIGTVNSVNYIPESTAFSSFDPITNSWERIVSLGGPPGRRTMSSAVWTGSKMLVFGAFVGAVETNQVFSYDLALNAWQKLSAIGIPTVNQEYSILWAGNRLIIWGGARFTASTYDTFNTGAMLDPVANLWTPMSSMNAPTKRTNATAVWSGSQMIVFGGLVAENPEVAGSVLARSGGIFDPVQNLWTSTSQAGAPSVRMMSTGVWTPKGMVIFGGIGPSNEPQGVGAILN